MNNHTVNRYSSAISNRTLGCYRSAHPLETANVVLMDPAVTGAFAIVRETQITNLVIIFIVVFMIDYPIRSYTVDDKPNQAGDRIAHTVHPYKPIAIAV